jgi:hypothetical protein
MRLYGYGKPTGACDVSGARMSGVGDGRGSGEGDADATVSGLLSGSATGSRGIVTSSGPTWGSAGAASSSPERGASRPSGTLPFSSGSSPLMQWHAQGLGPGKARGCPRGPETIYPKCNSLKRFRRTFRFRRGFVSFSAEGIVNNLDTLVAPFGGPMAGAKAYAAMASGTLSDRGFTTGKCQVRPVPDETMPPAVFRETEVRTENQEQAISRPPAKEFRPGPSASGTASAAFIIKAEGTCNPAPA